MQSFPWWRDNLRSRRGQATVLGAVVALLVAFATLLPLLTTSIASALVDDHVRALGPLGRTVEARTLNGETGVVPLEQVAPVVGAQWDGLAGKEIDQFRMPIYSAKNSDDYGSAVWRTDMCNHLTFSSGHCPTGEHDVAVSAASAKVIGLHVGSPFPILNDRPKEDGVNPVDPNAVTLTVSGIFAPRPGDDYWRGIDVSSVTTKSDPIKGTSRSHTWLVAQSLFLGTNAPPWGEVETSVARQLNPETFHYDKLPQAVAAVTTSASVAQELAPAQLTEQVSTIDGQVHRELDQIRLIAPLLLAQLVVLQAILVWIVLRSFVQARRQEVAVLRLRTAGRAGARRMLLGELLPPILIGLPLGLALGYALDWTSRHTWLPHTTLGAWSWTALGAAVLATVLCCLAAQVLVRGVVRTPIALLLRAVAPRSRKWSVSPFEAIVIAAGVALLVAVRSGSLTGAPVLITPLALAVAVGLVAGGLLVPAGNLIARRLLSRGRVATLLGTAALSRRPATRQAILAVTAAGAMLTFSVATLTLGQTNRANVAEATVGAPVRVIAIDTTGTLPVRTLLDTVRAVDPTGAHLAAVYRINSPGDGPQSLLGDPKSLSHIALHPRGVNPWAKLVNAPTEDGAVPAVTATWAPASTDPVFSGSALTDQLRAFHIVGTVDLIPGGDARTFVAPLAPLLNKTDRTDLYSTEVWSDGKQPELDTRMVAKLRSAGYADVTVTKLSATRSALNSSASAYGLQLGIVVAIGALLVAILVMIAVQQSQSAVRRRDQAALRRAGVGGDLLRRAGLVESALNITPILLGGIVGWVGAWLAASHVPWFTDAPAFDIVDTLPPILLPLFALLAGTVVLAVVALRVVPHDTRGGRP